MDDRERSDGERSDRPPPADSATLVVRTWLEPRDDGQPRLRGTLSELDGRIIGAFDSKERLAELVEHRVAGGSPSPDEPRALNDDDR